MLPIASTVQITAKASGPFKLIEVLNKINTTGVTSSMAALSKMKCFERVAKLNIQADKDNGAGQIWIGGSDLAAGKIGIMLLAGDNWNVEASADLKSLVNLNEIWVQTDTDNSKFNVEALYA